MNDVVALVRNNPGKKIRSLFGVQVFDTLWGKAEERTNKAKVRSLESEDCEGRVQALSTLNFLLESVEKIQDATLAHDDVVDESYFRRGAKSVWFEHGMSVAILGADVLFAETLEQVAQRCPALTLDFAKTLSVLARGAHLENELCGSSEWLSSPWLVEELADAKTGALFVLAARCACYVVSDVFGGEVVDEELWLDRSRSLGRVFQHVDDVLDVAALLQPVRYTKDGGLDIQNWTPSWATLTLSEHLPESLERLSGEDRKATFREMLRAKPALLSWLKSRLDSRIGQYMKRNRARDVVIPLDAELEQRSKALLEDWAIVEKKRPLLPPLRKSKRHAVLLY